MPAWYVGAAIPARKALAGVIFATFDSLGALAGVLVGALTGPNLYEVLAGFAFLTWGILLIRSAVRIARRRAARGAPDPWAWNPSSIPSFERDDPSPFSSS